MNKTRLVLKKTWAAKNGYPSGSDTVNYYIEIDGNGKNGKDPRNSNEYHTSGNGLMRFTRAEILHRIEQAKLEGYIETHRFST
jgi:hypothetical protein